MMTVMILQKYALSLSGWFLH